MPFLLHAYLRRHIIPATQVATLHAIHDFSQYLSAVVGIDDYVFPRVSVAPDSGVLSSIVLTREAALIPPKPCTQDFLRLNVAINGKVYVCPVGQRDEKKWHGIARAVAMDWILNVHVSKRLTATEAPRLCVCFEADANVDYCNTDLLDPKSSLFISSVGDTTTKAKKFIATPKQGKRSSSNARPLLAEAARDRGWRPHQAKKVLNLAEIEKLPLRKVDTKYFDNHSSLIVDILPVNKLNIRQPDEPELPKEPTSPVLGLRTEYFTRIDNAKRKQSSLLPEHQSPVKKNRITSMDSHSENELGSGTYFNIDQHLQAQTQAARAKMTSSHHSTVNEGIDITMLSDDEQPLCSMLRQYVNPLQ
ncbi:uncharacterized protein V1518DRAFT_402947 [Limtongia smithiae]|uniref:uncharacterized protein n=1 Tax=Limtongia smithiae TaxID=1125753 RepID=UPI0034CF5AEF